MCDVAQRMFALGQKRIIVINKSFIDFGMMLVYCEMQLNNLVVNDCNDGHIVLLSWHSVVVCL